MSIELQNDIKSSIVLKLYNRISKLAKFIPTIKWILGIAFVIALVDIISDGVISDESQWLNIIVWAPALIFAYVGAVLHFLTGLKIRNLSKKHGDSEDIIKVWADEILN
jgi:hypothetical protein